MALGGARHHSARPCDIDRNRSSQAFFDGVDGVAAEAMQGLEKRQFFVFSVHLPEVGGGFQFVRTSRFSSNPVLVGVETIS